MNIYIISLISTIIFGMIDGLFFLFAEESFQEKIKNLEIFDQNSSELMTGGISAAAAIFVSSIISKHIRKRYDILEEPFIDSIGIILGTIMVIIVYNIYKKYKQYHRKLPHSLSK